ncbi:MAG: FAD-dependent oxidoreductase, partial [Acidobacteria bacterium]|nr:FAD-dependent oxidoreductase [Acidobacteriota bacterium]
MVDLAVIGGGPGGYVAAIRAAQLKKKVVLIERDRIGGVCMNWGCIPTKSLLNQTKIYEEAKHCRNIGPEKDKLSLDWKGVLEEKNRVVERLVKGTEFLLERNGVELVRGEARLESEKSIIVEGTESTKKIEAAAVILATGSRPAELPFLRPNGDTVLTSRDALDLQVIPGSLLVVGAGAIGLEMATIFRRLGAEVTVLELLPHILPGSDIEMTTRLERLLKRQKIKIWTQMKAAAFVGLQEVENIGILEDIAAHEALTGYGYEAFLIEGTDSRGIDNGYLVRGDMAAVVHVEQHIAPEGLTSRPPLLIEVEVQTASGPVTVFVANNHFTSMSAGVGATEPRRTAQAAWNVSVLEGVLAANPEAYAAITGDLNSFYDSLPIDTLREAGLK